MRGSSATVRSVDWIIGWSAACGSHCFNYGHIRRSWAASPLSLSNLRAELLLLLLFCLIWGLWSAFLSSKRPLDILLHLFVQLVAALARPGSSNPAGATE